MDVPFFPIDKTANEIIIHKQLNNFQIAESYAFLPRDAVTKFLSGCHLCQKSSSPIPLLVDISLDSLTEGDFISHDESLGLNQSHENSVERYAMTDNGVQICQNENHSFKFELNANKTKHKNPDEISTKLWQHSIKNESFDEVNQTILAYYQLLLTLNGKITKEMICNPKTKIDNALNTERDHTMLIHNGDRRSLMKEWKNSSESVSRNPDDPELSDVEHPELNKNDQCSTHPVSNDF